MTSATLAASTTFACRGDGLRHSKTTGGNTTTFTWDVNTGLPVVLDDGNQYVYGAGLESMVTAGGTYYYLADGLGSTMAMVDTSGTVQKSYTYDVYGKPGVAARRLKVPLALQATRGRAAAGQIFERASSRKV